MEMMNTIQELLTSGLAFAVYIAIPAFIFIKAIRKKKLPSNHYTPLDVKHGDGSRASFLISRKRQNRPHASIKRFI
ncbi:hypothetical protein KJK41_04740 [Bacillus haikouensis]|nr:hypothetical protein KJK41_04740 [Bacillus haikouensis]